MYFIYRHTHRHCWNFKIINKNVMSIGVLFWWQITILQTTKCLGRRVALSYICTNLFNIWLNRRQLDFHICFWVQSFLMCCFGWRLWREYNLTQIYIWQSIFMVLLNNCRYSSLMINQNIVSRSFLEVSFSVECHCVWF